MTPRSPCSAAIATKAHRPQGKSRSSQTAASSAVIRPVTPYESAEGGYQWIWGGPYNAGEQLFSKFGDIVPESLIEEVTEELESMPIESAAVAGMAQRKTTNFFMRMDPEVKEQPRRPPPKTGARSLR
jgi:hypothetical protein